ncbi:MAG: hypothetical protein ABR547_01745 [Halanaerobium sp.]
MKKFLKKASIYLSVLLLIAAAVFGLNYFLGQRLARDLEADIEEIAAENNYQLRYLSINTNPLLRRVEINGLSLLKSTEQSLEINGAEVEFSWQQIFNYIKEREFLDKKDLQAEIDKFTYYDLQQNNNFSFYNSSLSYQGIINSESLKDPLELIKNNHNLTILSEELDYDYPYYRSYGINKDNWERISSFEAFVFKASYQSQDKKLSVNDFVLKNEFIDYELDFASTIDEIAREESDSEAEVDKVSETDKAKKMDETEELKNLENNLSKIVLYSSEETDLVLKELKSNYDLEIKGELAEMTENEFFKEFSFSNFNLLSNLEIYLDSTNTYYHFQEFDLDLDLRDFKLKLAESLSKEVNQSSFGILAQDDEFNLKIDSLQYEQQYSNPEGEIDSELISNMIDAELKAEFNYSEEMPYLSNSLLKFKAKNPSVEQLLMFAQLLYGEQFNQDEQGYYYLESWGNIDQLNFE